ncbi:MAG: IclR family transcriptional regulator [Salinigranum sp.]
MSQDHAPGRTVKASHTAFGIVEALQELQGAGVSELAEHLGMANSTIYDHLATLESMEYVVKDEEKVYRLSLKHLTHGMHAMNYYTDVIDETKPILQRMAERTDETVWFVVEEHGKTVYMYTTIGENPSTTPSRVGTRRPLHVTACGKAIMAHMPEERIAEILDRYELAERTENTVTDPSKLEEELAEIRECRYALNDEELIPGLRAVAVPIVVDDLVVGAVGVSGPTNRMRGSVFREEFPELMLGLANEVELRLKYSNRQF